MSNFNSNPNLNSNSNSNLSSDYSLIDEDGSDSNSEPFNSAPNSNISLPRYSASEAISMMNRRFPHAAAQPAIALTATNSDSAAFDNATDLKDDSTANLSAAAVSPPSSLSRQFDFRRGILPVGVSVVGEYELIPQPDNSTALQLQAGSHLKLDLNSIPNGGLRSKCINEYSLTLDVKLDSLPKEGISLYQTRFAAAGSSNSLSTEGEVFIYQSGGVGSFGEFGQTANWLRPNKWSRVVVTFGGPPTAKRLCTYVNSKPCAVINKGVFSTADGRFSIPTDAPLSLFASSKASLMPGLTVRFVEFTPRTLTKEQIQESSAANKIYSYWEADRVTEENRRFESFSLQSLYKRPPAIFQHPAFLAEFGDCFLEGLIGGSVSQVAPSFAVLNFIFSRLLTSDGQKYLNEFTDSDLQAISAVSEILKAAAELSKKFSIAAKNPAQLVHFLRFFRGRLESLKEGEFLVVPAGIGEAPISLVIERSSLSHCRFVVINTNPVFGLQYHPADSRKPGKIRFRTSLVIDGVAQAKLLDDAFWSILFKLTVMKSKQNTPEKLYDLLIPFLVNRSLEEILVDSQSDPALDWRTPQRAEVAFFKVASESVHYLLRRKGLTNAKTKLVDFSVRMELLGMIQNDLSFVSELSESDRKAIEIAAQQIAYSAAKFSDKAKSDLIQEEKSDSATLDLSQLESVFESLSELDCLLLSLPSEQSADPAELDLTLGDKTGENLLLGPQWGILPLAERLLRKEDVSGLAGLPIRLPAYVPVDYLLLPRRVESFDSAMNAIRYCDKLCTRISVQSHCIKLPAQLIVSLIEFTFLSLVPTPLPIHNSNFATSIWGSPIRYSFQLDILILLQRIVEHFAAAALSLQLTRSMDSIRLMVPASMAAIADCVLRQSATDIPSELSRHYAGNSSIGLLPYGISLGKFIEQSENSAFHRPELGIRRAAILDYFHSLEVPEANQIFAWEVAQSSESSLNSMFSQLCEEVAFPQPSDIGAYLSGEHYLILKNYPEFLCFRDLIFYFKFFMNSEIEAFPPVNINRWNQQMAQLKWVYDEGAYAVEAYGRMPLACKPKRGGFTIRFPSLANPTPLCAPNSVSTEDDVLHIKNLPSFENSLGQRDSELLISFLTVPYIRLPLCLSFFATEDRIHALKSLELQSLLESVLFEPGKFLPFNVREIPELVPTNNKQLLSTTYGHLLTELIRSPTGLLDSLLQLIKVAVDLDVGTMKSGTVDILLFVCRLACKVENHVAFIVEHANSRHETFNPESEMRDWELSSRHLSALTTGIVEIQKFLRGPIQRILEKYVHESMIAANAVGALEKKDDEAMDENTRLACSFHAHLSLIQRNISPSEFSADSIGLTISSIIFITTRHTWNRNLLPIPENEIFECLQIQRRRLIEWLRSQTDQIKLNEIMESAVRVATTTGIRKDGSSSSNEEKSPDRETLKLTRSRSQNDGDAVRRWGFVGGVANSARFTVAETRRGGMGSSYRVDNIPVVTNEEQMGIEIDLGLIQLTLRSAHLKALETTVAANEDVVLIFGSQNMQAATIQTAEHRDWIRLIGRNHDLFHWKTADPRPEVQLFEREYQPGELENTEKWIVPIFEPVRLTYFTRPFVLPIVMPEETLAADADCAILVGLHPKRGGTWKEIVVFKHLRVVHVYNVLSHGRRFYRSLEYTSDTRFTLRDMQPSLKDRDNPWPHWERHGAGHPYNEPEDPTSVVIVRHTELPANLSGTAETLIPSRLLFGIVPQALLDSHTFWQDESDNIRGYPIADSPHLISIKWSELKQQRMNRTAGVGIKIRRIPIVSGSVNENRSRTMEEEELILLNLLYAPPGTKLYSLAQCLTRIERLSYILAWTLARNVNENSSASSASSDDFNVDFLELPRLKMSFNVHKDENGTPRLYSMDHVSLFVSNDRSALTSKLISGLPHAIILSNSNSELNIFVPALRPVRPVIGSAPFSCELVLDRSDQDWLNALDTRYYLYPVHVSLSFMFTPTLASALYLLLLRFLHRDYDECFRLANTIANDTTLSEEEKLIFAQLGEFGDAHPNAHSNRLKIALVTADSPMGCPWNLTKEMSRLIQKLSHVSANCRLSPKEEVQLLSLCISDISDPRFDPKVYSEYEIILIKNRLYQLKTPANQPIQCFVPQRFRDTAWPNHFDLSALAAEPIQWQQLTLQFSASPLLSGVMALDCVHQFWSGQELMNGAALKLGFLFIYGLFTGTHKIRFGSQDDSFSTAVLLLQLMQDSRDHSIYSSILHILARNPEICSQLPKFNDKRQFKNETITGWIDANESSSPLDDLFSDLIPSLASLADFFKRPPANIEQLKPQPNSYLPKSAGPRDWLIPSLSDFLCEKRSIAPFDGNQFDDSQLSLSASDLNSFADSPLAPISLDNYLISNNREDRGLPPVDSKLPFDVSRHSQTKSEVAVAMLNRLKSDLLIYSELENGGNSIKFSALTDPMVHRFVSDPDSENVRNAAVGNARLLVASLTALKDSDSEYVNRAIPILVNLSNNVTATEPEDAETGNLARIRFLLRRYSGQESFVWLDYLIGSLLSSEAKLDLWKVNPFISDSDRSALFSLIASTIFHANRVGHCNRALSDCRDLIDVLEKSKPGSNNNTIFASISQKSDLLARTMSSRRYFVHHESDSKNSESSASFSFDPRFLVFEFTWNILLRKSQVSMVEDFMNNIRQGKSAVKQMIMGAGKSTVIAPLLCLMLGDGRRLVCEVVPPALLEFSRSVMRSTFSSIMYKRIYTLTVERATMVDEKLFMKLVAAAENSGIVISTPTAVKSLMLKFLELVDLANNPTRPRPPSIEFDIEVLRKILQLFSRSILCLDECDLLLHPLKSELNFPIGEKFDLDFNPLRWKLPIHLIDAIFYSERGRMSVGFNESARAVEILNRIRKLIDDGYESRALQRSPHIVLLNPDYYHETLKPALLDWAMLWIESQHAISGASEEEIRSYLINPSTSQLTAMKASLANLAPKHQKMLNLTRDWLHSFLPHVLAKIDRVSFGILSSADAERAQLLDPLMPHSRLKLAVPFVGKDVPSRSSEFAHPDIIIGLSVLAYQYEGIRESDFHDIISHLRATLSKELGPYNERKSSLRFEKFVKLAGGRIKGSKNVDETEAVEIVPLRLLKRSNEEQMQKLFQLLYKLPELIIYYLNEFIFPAHLRHQQIKLSASGQELGGSVLFPIQIGFSGTPSDLLPTALGRCGYEAGSDGQVISVLTDPAVVSFERIAEPWSVKSLLTQIAVAQPPYHALIDTGALITGLSNIEVARFLLDHGLKDMDGVVFLDEFDRKMILIRSTGRALKLAQCGIPAAKRFAFYDQIHTTGMDIQLLLSANAVLTLGKDMTFRDYAQGAYRMRGIGKGQKIHLFVIPEVEQLLNRENRAAKIDSVIAPVHSNNSDPLLHRTFLTNIAAWLVINSCRSERVQFNMLCLQNLQNVWRNTVYQSLISEPTETLSHQSAEIQRRIAVFKETINFTIESAVPEPQLLSNTADKLIDRFGEFIVSAEQKSLVKSIQRSIDGIMDEDVERAFEAELQAESEAEKEVEAEMERDNEIEIEKYVDLAYSRDSEEAKPWSFRSLRDSPAELNQFYSQNSFHLYKRQSLPFPDYLMISNNYFDPQWSGARRVKNTVMILEWIQNNSTELNLIAPRQQSLNEAINKAFQLFDSDSSGDLNNEELKKFIRSAMDFTPSNEEISSVFTKFGSANARALKDSESMKLLSSGEFRVEERDRYFIALSLAEAETIRRIIHERIDKPVIDGSNIALALHSLASGDRILDSTLNYRPASAHQASVAHQSLRFFDCEVHYTDPQLNLLLRAVQPSTARDRLTFFTNLIGCRRRLTRRYEETPIAKYFSLQNEFDFLHQRAMSVRTLEAIQSNGLLLYDAFRKFDWDRNGLLSPAELFAGLEWLGLKLSPEDVLSFLHTADNDRDGNLNYREFIEILRAENQSNEEWEKENEANNESNNQTSGNKFDRIPPKFEAELEQIKQRLAREDKEYQERELERERLEEKKIQSELDREAEEEDAKQIGGPNPLIDMEGGTVRFDFTTGRRPRFLTSSGDFDFQTEGNKFFINVQKSAAIFIPIPIAGQSFTFTAQIRLESAKPLNSGQTPVQSLSQVASQSLLTIRRGLNSFPLAVRADGCIGSNSLGWAADQKLRKGKWSFVTVKVDSKDGRAEIFIDGKRGGELKSAIAATGNIEIRFFEAETDGRAKQAQAATADGGQMKLLIAQRELLSVGEINQLIEAINEEEKWMCDLCTSRNSNDAMRCGVCNGPRKVQAPTAKTRGQLTAEQQMKMAILQGMGFQTEQCRDALEKCNFDENAAIELLFAGN